MRTLSILDYTENCLLKFNLIDTLSSAQWASTRNISFHHYCTWSTRLNSPAGQPPSLRVQEIDVYPDWIEINLVLDEFSCWMTYLILDVSWIPRHAQFVVCLLLCNQGSNGAFGFGVVSLHWRGRCLVPGGFSADMVEYMLCKNWSHYELQVGLIPVQYDRVNTGNLHYR